jgi:SAM-dependent methyltransferase
VEAAFAVTGADDQARVSAHYRALVRAHGASPEGAQMSAEGQRFRFAKLLEVCDLNDLSVLDLGCGPGALIPELRARYPRARYTGLDVVSEMVAAARACHPDAAFLVHDLGAAPLPGDHDVVLASALFNNARPDAGAFLRRTIAAAWRHARRALAFNFISTRVTRRDAGMAYHDPASVLAFCLDTLSPRVRLEHHYQRCDVAVFVYRQ